MERKTVIGLAAVAAVAVLLYMRKQGASAATAGTGGVLSSNAAALNAAMGNVAQGFVTPQAAAKPTAINVLVASPTKPQTVSPTKPERVEDYSASAKAPASVAVFGGSSAPRASAGSSGIGGYTVSESGLRTYADGSTYQMTPNELYMYNLNKGGKSSFVYAG